MSTELDCYGMTPEERAELEKTWNATPTRDHAGRYVDSDTSNEATGWAACARLNREKLVETEDILRQVCEQYETAATEVEELQIGNNVLLTRIKELEAENLRIKSERDEAGALFTKGTMACLEAAQKVQAENERLRAAIDAAMKGGGDGNNQNQAGAESAGAFADLR